MNSLRFFVSRSIPRSSAGCAASEPAHQPGDQIHTLGLAHKDVDDGLVQQQHDQESERRAAWLYQWLLILMWWLRSKQSQGAPMKKALEGAPIGSTEPREPQHTPQEVQALKSASEKTEKTEVITLETVETVEAMDTVDTVEAMETTLTDDLKPRKGRDAKRSDAKRKRKVRPVGPQALPSIAKMFARRPRKLLVLDLDETLIHSMRRGVHRNAELVEVHSRHSALPSFYYVAKRPYLVDFLNAVRQWYDLAIFTASLCEYADPIIDLLEHDFGGRQIFKHRLYRDSCTADGCGGYIKDLTLLAEDLGNVLIVDNSPISFAHQQTNGLEVEGWISDPSDRVLLQLLPLLFALQHTNDVRSILALRQSRFLS